MCGEVSEEMYYVVKSDVLTDSRQEVCGYETNFQTDDL